MGDFDRHPQPQHGKQSKQVVVAITLAVVLIGVLGFHFMKPGPQSAMASSLGPAGAAPPPLSAEGAEESAEQAAIALRQDPTARLLRENSRVEKEFTAIPRNPFLLSDTLRASLIRLPDAPIVTPQRPTDPIRPTRIPQPVKVDSFKLASIIRANDRLSAIINGHIVTAGMIVDGARVVEITADRVLLQNAQSPDGPTAELTIDPKLK
jgi:hypothetical protein